MLGAAVAYGGIMREVLREISPQRPAAIVPAVLPPYVPGTDVWHGDLARMTGDPARFGEPDFAPLGKVLADPASRCAKRIDAPAPTSRSTRATARNCRAPSSIAIRWRFR